MSSPASPALEIVTSSIRLAEIAAAWNALWRRLDGLVFQSHGWVSAWWHTDPNRDRRALRIGLVWKGDELDAVLPLATLQRSGIRVLEWAAKDHVDFGDILVAPNCDRTALVGIWSRLMESPGHDMIYLNRMLPDAAVRPLLTPVASSVRLYPNHREELNFRVEGQWTYGVQWFEAQSKKTRQNYRRGCKFIEEAGALQFRLMEPGEPRAPVLERVAELKRKWLARSGQRSELFDEGSQALPALVGVLAEAGILRIFVLECAGVVIAVSINFVQHGRMMAFVTTYDPDYERASPGMVLMMDYICWSIDHGLEMVDFLCGGEDFKRRFATRSETLDSVRGARTLAGRVACLADDAGQAVRDWKAKRDCRALQERAAAD